MNAEAQPPDVSPRCPYCGTPREPDAPDGLCPYCLLQLARESADAGELDPESPLKLGEFADYELLSELGHGGMGVVYQARQKSLDRLVALKMLLGGQFAEASARARFRSEAEITAQLQHPNIVAIHEVGEHDHLPFFTMDYVEGRSLAEVARDKPLTPAAAAGYMATIARAIAYAHERGVLHRDLKPSNILIDGSDQPRITDFGLAKRLTGSTTSLTLSGEALGSPNFMPPEQAAGRHKEIGPASDVYGLGAILYYLVTSRPPFVADNLSMAVRQVQDQEPVSPRMLNPGVPKDLETICLKCLLKEPSKRYATAGELADELDRFRRGEPILGRPVGTVGRAWRWCRRRPALAAALAGVFVLAGVSTTAAVRMALAQEGRERERYRANIQLAAARIEEGSIDVALETLLDCPERFRHWEWGYLVAQCHREVLTLEEARDATRNETLEFENLAGGWRCAFGVGDERVGVFHPQGIAQVWELPSGKPVWSFREQLDPEVGSAWLPDWSGIVLARSNVVEVVRSGDLANRLRLLGHTQTIRRLALSQDGRRVVACAADGLVRVWNTIDGVEVSAFPVIPGVQRLFFTGDGTRLVVASPEEGATYEVHTGKELSRLVGNTEHTVSVIPDPEGERFVTVSYLPDAAEGNLRLWTTNGLVSDLGAVMSFLYPEAGFSSDRSTFFTTGHGSTAAVREALTGKSLLVIPTRVMSGALSPDGRRLATRGGTSVIHVWEPASRRELFQLKGHTEPVHDVDFSHDGRLLASVSAYGTLKLWSALPGREFYRSPGLPWGLAHTSDGRKVANAHLMDQITVRDAQSGQLLEHLRRQRRTTTALTISPDDRYLVAGDIFGEIAIWELASGRLMHSWRAHEFFVYKVAYTRDGRCLLSSGGDGKLRQWDAKGTRELRTFELATNAASFFDISPDGRRLATGFGKALRFWNLETGQCERELPGHSELVGFLKFTPDGKRLMTTAMDHTLRIWDATSGRSLASWKLHGDAFVFAISPDGKRVALRASQGVGCGMDAPTVELWDAESGHQLLSYRGFMEMGGIIGFSPDGRRLVSDWWLAELRQWEAFPWRDADYPGNPRDALRDRLRWFARQYWQDRLEAETRMAITNSTVFVDLPYDRSRFPPRDPAAPGKLIDLTAHYTGVLDECNYVSANGDYSRIDLRNVPRGIVTFQGVPFDVRGVIQTTYERGAPVMGDYPVTAGPIPVRQTCQQFHAILGIVGNPAEEGALIGAVVLHYADGSRHELEIFYGRHVRHWWTEGDPRTDTDLARVAWEGPHGYPAIYSTRLRVFHAVWDNPRPDQEIVSFDFVSKATNPAPPFLVAVTVE